MNAPLFLPAVEWPAPKPDPQTGGVAPRPVLAQAAAPSDPGRQQTMRFAAIGAPVRVILGEARVAPLVCNAIVNGNYLYLQLLWCWDSLASGGVQSVLMNEEAIPSGDVQLTHYDGGAGNVVDPWLSAAFAAAGKSYTDTLPGWCYSVAKLTIWFVSNNGIPTFSAIVRGVQAYDDRSSTTAWTDNPSLLAARYVEDPDWGMGYTVNHATVQACADANDDLVGAEKRRRIGLAIDADVDVGAMLEALRTYAGCWVLPGENGVEFIPDRPLASLTPIGEGASIVLRTLDESVKRGRNQAPTLVRVWYTDRTVTPWRSYYAEAQHPLLATAGVERRESDVRLPGIQSYSQALREATERLNKLTLSDLTVKFGLFDEGIQFRPGDGVTLTNTVAALTAKPLRIFSRDGGLGDWDFVGVEYDPAAYSDAVGTDPSFADTPLASPSNPQPPAGLILTEEVFEVQGDNRASRIKATWTAPANFPWSRRYRINVVVGSTVIDSGSAEANGELVFRSGALTEGVTYQVDVYTVSSNGTLSSAASATLLAQAAGLIPGDVPAVTGFEAGGTVRLAWSQAIDIDIRRYEVRYVSVGGAWSAGTMIDRVDTLRLTTQAVPAGTWDFHVRAIDSRGNVSANSAVVQIDVTFDDGAFLLDDSEFTTVGLTNAVELVHPRGGSVKRYVSTDGVPWNSKFTSALGTYSGPVLGHFNTLASEIKLPSAAAGYDFGLSLSGNWVGEIDASALSGTVTENLGLDNGGGFTDFPAQVAKTTARFARVNATCAAGSACIVRVPPARVRISAVGRKFKGTATSLASGVLTIDITSQVGEIAAFNGPVKITPRGTSAVSYSVDNYVTGASPSFDPYLFDAAGSRIATDFDYEGEVV